MVRYLYKTELSFQEGTQELAHICKQKSAKLCVTIYEGGLPVKNNELLIEIRDLLKVMTEDQQKLVNDVRELRSENKKLREEIRLSNIVLNNIAARNEILN